MVRGLGHSLLAFIAIYIAAVRAAVVLAANDGVGLVVVVVDSVLLSVNGVLILFLGGHGWVGSLLAMVRVLIGDSLRDNGLWIGRLGFVDDGA